ncbi:IS701 family transposase [Solwaraspora sp. WMMD937]|uniref:IS701 family transposase n=1 Tax=Solwaraspora sp. WMMD937 TaxID=3016090 RepID=UPI00249B3E79|nr:IS701 family transposase [Solwaraspora sp. WMMD937]WFE22479.1 IS701 family transposase [Solwaraspora sp. WMMD937]
MAAAAMVEAGRVEENLATLMGDLGTCFARVEPRRQAGKYVRGLIADLPRKNCWTLAEHAGDPTPDRTQRLLERAVWDTDKAMGVVRDFAVARLADPDGDNTLIFDESGVEKTGTGTCGVTRQYVGCAGKVTNAVNLVNATYATRAGHALVGSRLWIPAADLDDDARRAATGVPADTEFATKPRLATDLLTETLDAGVPVRWCTADAVYGRDRRLRDTCETRGIGYSLGVPCPFRITLPGWKTKIRADTAAATLTTDTAWQTMSCGPGSKGDRWYAWAWIATAGPRHYLLVRRSLADPDDLAYFYCWIPERLPATLTALVRVTGRRWTIEEDHGFGKDHFGFDQFLQPPPHPDHAAHRAGHGRARRLRGHRRRRRGRDHATTPTHPPQRTTTGRPRTRPADRGRDQTVVQPRDQSLAQPRTPSPLVLVAPPPSSPRPLVPLPIQTHMIKSRSTAALLGQEDHQFESAYLIDFPGQPQQHTRTEGIA